MRHAKTAPQSIALVAESFGQQSTWSRTCPTRSRLRWLRLKVESRDSQARSRLGTRGWAKRLSNYISSLLAKWRPFKKQISSYAPEGTQNETRCFESEILWHQGPCQDCARARDIRRATLLVVIEDILRSNVQRSHQEPPTRKPRTPHNGT